MVPLIIDIEDISSGFGRKAPRILQGGTSEAEGTQKRVHWCFLVAIDPASRAVIDQESPHDQGRQMTQELIPPTPIESLPV